VSLLQDAGFINPALLSLEYSLVPDAQYPTQIQQTVAGYRHALSIMENSSRICVAGDSAGGTLILSFLLALANHGEFEDLMPFSAVMISPWVKIISDSHVNTSSDYLDADTLHTYGRQYLGKKVAEDDPSASPGHCTDLKIWARASPTKGWFFAFGSEETLGADIRDLIGLLRKAGADVEAHEEKGHIHAWPVASLYLGETKEARLHGIRAIVKTIKRQLH
jgi:acetyl esterase/lipase